ncbi:MAG: flagellar protein FlaG [Desulfotomaculaceae bacterium]
MRIASSQTTVSRISDMQGTTVSSREGRSENTRAETALACEVIPLPEKETAEEVVREENLEELVRSSHSTLESKYVRFEFNIHEATNKVMVKVVDKNTDEVIREIPPEKILDMVAKMWELAGLFIDEKI